MNDYFWLPSLWMKPDYRFVYSFGMGKSNYLFQTVHYLKNLDYYLFSSWEPWKLRANRTIYSPLAQEKSNYLSLEKSRNFVTSVEKCCQARTLSGWTSTSVPLGHNAPGNKILQSLPRTALPADMIMSSAHHHACESAKDRAHFPLLIVANCDSLVVGSVGKPPTVYDMRCPMIVACCGKYMELAQSDHARGCLRAHLCLLLSYCSQIFTEESSHVILAGSVVRYWSPCFTLQSSLSKFGCSTTSHEQFCDMTLTPWETPHVSNWCHANKWWIRQCMNLQLSQQMTTALTTSHGSRVARTIRSSHAATKA